MTSRAIDIRDAVIATLNTDRPSDVPEATKRRRIPGDRIVDPVVGVFLHEEPARYPRGNNRSPVTERTRLVIVQIGVSAEDPGDLDDFTEAIREHVVARLGDTTLSGLGLAVEDRGVVEAPIAYKLDLYTMLTHVGFAVPYQTKRDDLGRAH